jgi:AhpD family alkylhydroperoxidase
MMDNLDKSGKLLNLFRGLANSAAALDAYLAFSGALGKGKLDARTRESLALAIGQANRCDYCLAAHTRIGQAAGLDEASIREARLGRAKDRKAQGAIALARTIVEKRGGVFDADVSAARQAGLDDAEIAEVVGAVALNVFTNYFNLLNRTDVDFPSVAVDIG